MVDIWRAIWMTVLLAVVTMTTVLVGSATAGGEEESVHAEHRGVGIEALPTLEAVPQATLPALEILPDRSLFVRHPDLLAGLSFATVMEQLAGSAGAVDGKALFQQWWSTVVPAAADKVAAGLGCPEPGATATVPSLKNFPMLCDAQFASIATMPDPLGATSQVPPFRIIAAVNRIDLREPASAKADCGEFRIIAAWNPQWDGWPDLGENSPIEIFMNFEAIIPDKARDGRLCAAIQEFWARFSNADGAGAIPNDAAVADALARFYLEGGRMTPDGRLLPQGSADYGFDLGPVLHADNLGRASNILNGQIRVNTLTRQGWVLREFEFASLGDISRIVAMPTGGSIDPSVFADGAPGNSRLAEQILLGSEALMTPSINGFTFTFGASLQASQMVISVAGPPVPTYETMLRTPANTVRQNVVNWAMVTRLEALSCAGCHHNVPDFRDAGFVDHVGRPVSWPGSLRFTHILPELGPDGGYIISDLVKCIALPHREAVMRAELGRIVADPTPAIGLQTGCAHLYPN